MPLAAPTISKAVLAQSRTKGLTGIRIPGICDAVGAALATYLAIPNLVTCTFAGTAGPVGSITSLSVAGLVPTAMSGFMLSRASMKTLIGRDIIRLVSAISIGICQNLQTTVLTGSVLGCAVGTGIGSFTAVNEQALSQIMFSQMLLKDIRGRDAINLCDCISFGVVRHLQSSVKYSVAAAGPIAPTPPTGPVPVAAIPSVFTKVS
jgi:hypothetical protein